MVTSTVFEAKTNLSRLLQQAQQGEVVVITSGRERTPVARLEAVAPVVKQRLGALETPGFALPADFFEPMAEDELRQWEGGE